MPKIMQRLGMVALACWLLLVVGVRAQAQNPGGITTAALQWNKADALTSTDGTAITSWTASAGQTLVQGSAGTAPLYRTAGPNSKPYLAFGTTGGLITTALSSSAGSYTIFVVVRVPDTVTPHWALDTQTGRMVAYPYYVGTPGSGYYDGSFHSVQAQANVPLNTWMVWELTLDSTTGGILYENGTQVGSSTYSPKAIGGTTAIGNAYDYLTGGGGSTTAPVGDMAEIIVWNSLLNSADRGTVRGYLGTKYAITVTGVGLSAGGITANATTASSITPQLSSITGGTAPYSTVFSYSTTTNGTYTQIGTAVAGANPVASTSASGLSASTTYYFRAVVTDSAGTPATITLPSGTTGTPLATSAAASVTIANNNAGLLYSPYNWQAGKTINAGAYVRTLLNAATTCVINWTVGTATPYAQLLARVDRGAWQQFTPGAAGAQTSTVTFPLPSTATKHLLEIVVKSTTETADRWNSQLTAVTLNSLSVDAGASVSLPPSRPYRVLIFGDSITEGVRVNGFTGITNDTDRNNATLDYSWLLAESLNAEIGIVGFGATGLTVAGSGNVPALATSYASLWSGQARSFSPVPDLVIYNEGSNESGATLGAMTTALQTVINGIGYTGTANTYAALNGTRHLVLRPFNGAQASNLSAIVAGYGSNNIVYGDTTGFWSTADSSDSLHPYAYAHLQFAPQVAKLATPVLRNAVASGTKRKVQ